MKFTQPSTPKKTNFFADENINDVIETNLQNPDLNFQEELQKLEPFKASWMVQFWACLTRAIKSILKEPLLIKIRIIQNILFALMVGFLYFDQSIDGQESIININGALFWAVMNQFFSTYSTMLRVFSFELPIMFRENSQGLYKISSYFMARMLADMPLFLLTPVIFMAIYYNLVGFSVDLYKFGMTTLVAMLVVQVATSFGYCMASCSPDFSFATSYGFVFTTPLLAFGGVYINSK